ncbi:hypothetical protein BLA15816_04201 [Burkholderia lata]|nr:hypothetical protein BLA15816_04201 [Burkholderia lata]
MANSFRVKRSYLKPSARSVLYQSVFLQQPECL